jgi:nitrilase
MVESRGAEMATMTVAAVQAAYVLMDREATLAKVEGLLADPAVQAADLVVFPEAFVPGTPIWIDGTPIWDGDEQWFAMLADQAVVVPSETTDRLGAAAREAGVYLVIGVDEREPTGSTIYNTLLYFDPHGSLIGKHRKLMPTGSERTVWGMGDGSTLETYATPFGRIGGLICWENYMPLARFFLYSQGVDVWVAPTLAQGDGWIATMRHIAREGRCYVIGVNPCVHVDQIPADWSGRLGLGGAREHGDRRPQREDPRRTGTRVRDHPRRGAGPDEGAVCETDVRPGRALPPARRVPARRRHGPASRRHDVAPGVRVTYGGLRPVRSRRRSACAPASPAHGH